VRRLSCSYLLEAAWCASYQLRRSCDGIQTHAWTVRYEVIFLLCQLRTSANMLLSGLIRTSKTRGAVPFRTSQSRFGGPAPCGLWLSLVAL